MPYQPTNPYPYNTGVDLREGLTLQFRVDNYDTIIKFEIEIYDLFKNEKIYTIVREMGDIETIDDKKTLIEGEKQIIRIFDGADTLLYFDYYEGESVLPVVGGLPEENICKVELTNYLKTIEQVNYERYYNRVTDFTNFVPTEINDVENPNESYYILDEEDYIKGINSTYQYIFNDLTRLIVPYQVQGKLVRGIKENVFQGLTNLQEVILPSTIYEIGKFAFGGCTGLENVIFSYGLTKLGEEVFYNCESLRSINLLDSIDTIGTSCFEKCVMLSNLVLSNSLTEIPEKCFSNNQALTSLKLKQIQTIGKEAFAGCFNLNEIIFSKKLTTIGTSAFLKCTGINKLEFPDEDENITIGEQAFSGCKGITEINFTKMIQTIGTEAFAGCTNLYKIIIPENPEETIEKTIGEQAFLNCSSVYEVSLPKDLTTVGLGAFKGCNNIIEITIPFIGKQQNLESGEESLFGYIFGKPEGEETGTLQKYSDEDKDEISFLIPSSIAKVIISNEEIIPYGAFYNCQEIMEIILNEGVKTIYDCAFYNCYNLINIQIPSSVEKIGDNVFGLDKLEEVTE